MVIYLCYIFVCVWQRERGTDGWREGGREREREKEKQIHREIHVWRSKANVRIWNLIPCGSQGSHLSVSVARVFTYVWSHLTNLREPFYLTHFCSEVKDERKKFNSWVSQSRVCCKCYFMWHPVSAEIFKCWYSSCTQLALSAWLCHSTISYFNSLETSMGKPVCYYLYFFVIPINHTQTLGVRYYKKIFFFPNQCGRLQEPVRLGFPNVISTSNVHKSSCKPNFLSSDRFFFWFPL